MKCLKCLNEAAVGFLYCGKTQCLEKGGIIVPDYASLWENLSKEIALPKLAQELSEFRIALKKESKSPEHDVAVGFIANAEIDARKLNGPGVLANLSNIGQKEITFANNIKAELITKAIKSLY